MDLYFWKIGLYLSTWNEGEYVQIEYLNRSSFPLLKHLNIEDRMLYKANSAF